VALPRKAFLALLILVAMTLSFAGSLPAVTERVPFHVLGDKIYDINDTFLRRFPTRFAGSAGPYKIAHDTYGDQIVERMATMVEPFGGYAEKRPFIDEGTGFANLVAVVPGADPILANEFVILGGHYDCTQTHLDGAIDCGMQVALDLEILRAFTDYWRVNRVRPERSLMVLFTDGEEQCLCGSVDVTTIGTYRGIEHLELPPQASAVAFHDTDMIGANYPGRYFGRADLDFMPLNIFSAPAFQDPNPAVAAIRTLPAYAASPVVLASVAEYQRYRADMRAARDRMFEDMRTTFGHKAVTYADGARRPVFTEAQKKYVNIIDDPLDRSDHAVLILQGVPADVDIGLNDPTSSPPGLLQYHNLETLEFLNWMYSGRQRRSPLTELGVETAGMFVAYMLGANHAEAGDFMLGETDA
jgi:hypothetical protein